MIRANKLLLTLCLAIFVSASCTDDDTSDLTFSTVIPDNSGTSGGTSAEGGDDSDTSEEDLDDDTTDDTTTTTPGSGATEGASSEYLATPHTNPELYAAIENCTEDFGANGATTWDASKWASYDDNGFAAWTFVAENVTIGPDEGNNPESGEDVLCVTAKYDPHNRSNSSFDFTFKSGILRSLEPVGYGYYEARLKGSDVWPGTCSAFWLYSITDKTQIMPREEGTIIYNEVDIVEIQQIASNQRKLASNCHLMYLNASIANTWAHASAMPQLAQTQYDVDFYPDDDYHIYACENRPDSGVFYLDNVRVGGKKNYYWHMDEGMYITFSLGMRTPYEFYDDDGVRQPTVLTDEQIAVVNEIFPSSMYVDYVNSYTRDYSDFPSSEIHFDVADIY